VLLSKPSALELPPPGGVSRGGRCGRRRASSSSSAVALSRTSTASRTALCQSSWRRGAGAPESLLEAVHRGQGAVLVGPVSAKTGKVVLDKAAGAGRVAVAKAPGLPWAHLASPVSHLDQALSHKASRRRGEPSLRRPRPQLLGRRAGVSRAFAQRGAAFLAGGACGSPLLAGSAGDGAPPAMHPRGAGRGEARPALGCAPGTARRSRPHE
jgi:hypothetical protein